MNVNHFALALGAVLALSGAAQAQDFKPKAAGDFILNVRISDVAPVGSDPITTLAGASTGLNAKVGNMVMPSLGLTYFLTDHWAVEAIATTTEHQIKAQGPGTNVDVRKTWVLPPVVSLQYHFAPAAKVSPYVGAGLNYMLFYGGKDQNNFQLRVKDGFGEALVAGVDVAAGGPWSLNFDVKKVFFQTKAEDSKNGLKATVNLDPWVLSAGAGYRF